MSCIYYYYYIFSPEPLWISASSLNGPHWLNKVYLYLYLYLYHNNIYSIFLLATHFVVTHFLVHIPSHSLMTFNPKLYSILAH